MKNNLKVILCACLCFCGIVQTQAQDSLSVKTKLIGMGSFEAGQFMKAEMLGVTPVTHLWYQRAYVDLGFSATINERTLLYFVAEGMAHYNTTTSKDIIPNDFVLYRFYPQHVEGTYSFGDLEKPYLQLGFGIFPYKYNDDVRNFGGYLFRTLTYPPVMVNQFDYTITPLTGLRLTSTLLDSLHLCAMLTSESQNIQLQDYNISLLADYTLLKAVTIGGGAFFSRILSVNDGGTTPHVPNNIYVDPVTKDTTYWSFAGTKLMARLAIDPKVFFPCDLFGANDLRFYSEVAIIGTKDYPLYYDQLWKRVPIMAGFNFPTFKILDVLNLEVEYYRWNFPNSYTNAFFASQSPKPDPLTQNFNSDEQNLRWSFYAKRHIGSNISIIGQIAYDHSRIESNVDVNSATYYGDAMHKHGDWAWTLKSEFDF